MLERVGKRNQPQRVIDAIDYIPNLWGNLGLFKKENRFPKEIHCL
jgi:hypothetical protein